MTVSVNSIPVRLPCKWTLSDSFGNGTIAIQSHGISNRQVVIVIEKDFSLVERFLARVLRAPKYLENPMSFLMYTKEKTWTSVPMNVTMSNISRLMGSFRD